MFAGDKPIPVLETKHLIPYIPYYGMRRTKMSAKLYYLPFGEEARDVRHDITYGEGELTPEIFESHYDLAGTDEGAESIEEVFARWNRGSGRECAAFLSVECVECEETFENPREGEVHGEEEDHTIEGTRSLSSGDVVVYDDEAYLCLPIGWERVEEIESAL